MSKDARYFKHDSNARHDPKIKSLINKLGIISYARFWILIEMLRESAFYRMEIKEFTWEVMAEEMKCTPSEAKSFIDECVARELIVNQDNIIYSNSLLRRMDVLDHLKEARRKAGSLGGKATWSD